MHWVSIWFLYKFLLHLIWDVLVIHSLQFSWRALLQYVIQHACNLLCEEGQRPTEEIKPLGQLIGWLRVRVLFQLQIIILENEHTRFVLVAAAVVGRGEDRDYVRERVLGAPSVHLETLLLDLVPTEYTQKPILSQQLLDRLFTKVV